MKVIVCGDRYWNRYAQLYGVMNSIIGNDWMDLHIIEGGARGADHFARLWALEMGHDHKRVDADWKRHGKAAGPIRNQAMLKLGPDLVVAFHRNLDTSRGTRDMVGRAMKAGVKVMHWNGEELVTLRLGPC